MLQTLYDAACAAAMTSINNLLLLGDGETWSRERVDFGGLPEMVRTFLQVAAGAADIPVTRLLGQSPSGLSATGESDTRNYYDMIAARQELDLRPQLERLDRLLLRSAGLDPGALTFAFRPLWQLDAASAAAIALQKAQATQIYAGLGLWPAAVTARLVQAQLVQDGTYPSAAAVFAEGAAASDSITDARPVADLSATGFAPWANEPRDPDGRWTTGGGTSAEAAAPDISDPPLDIPGPHAPDGTPIELASFKKRGPGRLQALAALLNVAARLWKRWRPSKPDEPADDLPTSAHDPAPSPSPPDSSGESPSAGSTNNIHFGNNANQIYHVYRHIKATGLDPEGVADAVKKDIKSRSDEMKPGLNKGVVTLDGRSLEYNAFKFENGDFNVGRITIQR